MGPVLAAASPNPTCTLTGSPVVLSAINLPNDTLLGLTLYPGEPVNPRPGGGFVTTDGTYTETLSMTPPITAYFWQRGHGPSLIKLGPQLNDYKVIAICAI